MKYWVSCTSFTVMVETNDIGIIIDGAPLIKKFIGQPFGNLEKWMSRMDGVIIEELNEKAP